MTEQIVHRESVHRELYQIGERQRELHEEINSLEHRRRYLESTLQSIGDGGLHQQHSAAGGLGGGAPHNGTAHHNVGPGMVQHGAHNVPYAFYAEAPTSRRGRGARTARVRPVSPVSGGRARPPSRASSSASQSEEEEDNFTSDSSEEQGSDELLSASP